MKINVATPILDRAGEPVKMGDNPLTLRLALLMAIDAQMEEDRKLDAASKLNLHRIGMLIFQNDEVDLPAEDVALLKKRAGVVFAPLVLGRVFELIDPAG